MEYDTVTSYEIKGYTKATSFCSSGLWSTKDMAKRSFKRRYPRFVGNATLWAREARVLKTDGAEYLARGRNNHSIEIASYRSAKEIDVEVATCTI